MAGSKIERSPGVWQLRLYAGTDPITGRERRRYRTVRGTEREADIELARFVVDEADEGPPDTNAVTVGQTIDAWLDVSTNGPSTKMNHRSIRRNLPAGIADRRLDKLTRAHVEAWVARMYGEGLAPQTIRNRVNLVRRAIGWAVGHGWIKTNPASGVRLPGGTFKPPECPTLDESRAIRAAARDHSPEVGALVHVALATGLRRGELVALRWSDVADGVVSVSRAIAVSDGGLVEKSTKTRRAREVPLDATTVRVLDEHRDYVAGRDPRAGEPDAFVWSQRPDHSTPMDPSAVHHRWRWVRERAGVDYRFHDLRHFSATHALRNGVPVTTVSKRCGHSSPRVTLEVYAHALAEDDQTAADVIGRLLDDT